MENNIQGEDVMVEVADHTEKFDDVIDELRQNIFTTRERETIKKRENGIELTDAERVLWSREIKNKTQRLFGLAKVDRYLRKCNKEWNKKDQLKKDRYPEV